MKALRHKNYRLFFLGQSISLIGMWMQSVAMSWLVFRLTNSTFKLGLVGFAGQIPAIILSPFAGVVSDILSRHRIVITTQTLSMIQAFTIAFITLSGSVQYWHILLLAFSLGLINSFDMPVRQAFVVEMVENKSDIGSAIALNSSLFNGSMLIGPLIAGILIGLFGEGICFLINGFSFFAVIIALVMMKIPPKQTKQVKIKVFSELKDGIKYSFGFEPIRDMLIIVSLIHFIGMSFIVLLPVFAAHVLHGGSHTYSYLVAANGVGAIIGTLFLALRKNVLGIEKLINISIFSLGLGILIFSFSRSLFFSMFLLFATGFGLVAGIASCNTVIQTVVEEDKRGRVMSFYIMAFMSSAPLGSLFAGSISSIIGATLTAQIEGIMALVGSIIFAWRLPYIKKRIYIIYEKLGIIH